MNSITWKYFTGKTRLKSDELGMMSYEFSGS